MSASWLFEITSKPLASVPGFLHLFLPSLKFVPLVLVQALCRLIELFDAL